MHQHLSFKIRIFVPYIYLPDVYNFSNWYFFNSLNLSGWWPKDDSWVGFNLKNVKNVSKSVNIHECLSQNYYLNSKPHPSAVELEMILCHFVQMHLIPSPDSSHNLLDMLRENSDGSAISCAIKYDCFCWIAKVQIFMCVIV